MIDGAEEFYIPEPGIELYLGDSARILPAMRREKRRVGMVLCDPPYGIKYQASTTAKRKLAYDERPHTEFIAMMTDLMEDDTAMYVCTRSDVAETWRQAMRECFLDVKYPHIVWDKRAWSMGDAVACYRAQYEDILIAHNGRAKLRSWTWGQMPRWSEEWGAGPPNKEVRRDTALWSFPRPTHALHPTPKPPEIMERAMLNHSDLGDWVLDPFMGTAPVGVAAVRQGRRYIGIELEEDYFRGAVETISKAIEERDNVLSL